MKLFEFLTGWIGESYERLYVWAHDESEARRLAEPNLKGHEVITVLLLLKNTDEPFATLLSDSGWREVPAEEKR